MAKVTIHDVARESGVSTTTVSHVLNNRPGRVSAEMRERVFRVVRELKYQPKAVFRGKQATQTNVIGVVWQVDGLGALLEHPYRTYLLDGILSVTTPNRVHVMLFSAESWSDSHLNLRTYVDGRCDGLILAAPETDNTLRQALLERGFPFMVINAASKDPLVSSVDVDNIALAEQLTHYLIAKNHQRIAFLCGSETSENGRDRLEGFQRAFVSAQLPLPPEFILPGAFWHQSGYENTQKILKMPSEQRPTALFCCSDQIARGAYRALQEAGLRIPEDMSVVGFDDLPIAESLTPPLTTVRQPFQAMGRQAAEYILQHVQHATSDEAIPVTKTFLPAQIIKRGSVS
jgi:LacI family transcriptional regulator